RVERTIDDLVGACGGDRQVAVARELTKIYESVWRGSLADTRVQLRTTTPRGEYAIVLQGAPPPAEITDQQIPIPLHKALVGHTRKDAIAVVVGQLAVPKRRVYDLALAVNRDV